MASDRPFSLQPPPPPDRGPRTIAEFIQRVNRKPGGFRALNEADIRRQIEAAKHNKDGQDGDVDVDADVDMDQAPDDDEPPRDELKEIQDARNEILRSFAMAHGTAAGMVDSISLLVSKEIPRQASETLNAGLRNEVGIGTLGATTLSAPTPLAQSRVRENKVVAMGMRLETSNKVADALEASAARLDKECGLETTYWEQVRETSERGWNVFRHPEDRHVMGVRFGFSGAAPQFKANSIAPMRRADDGTVKLELSRMTRVPKRLQVTIKRGDVILGQSRLPRPSQDDVKEARDTVFAQELWHELYREGRSLYSHKVRVKNDSVDYHEDDGKTLSFGLVTLDPDAPVPESRPADAEAEHLNNTIQILLIHAHKQNETKRSEQAVPSATTAPPPPYHLLLPIIAYRRHEQTVRSCIDFLTSISRVLRSAGIPASFTLTEPPITGSSTDSLATTLLNPPGAEFDVTLTPAARLRVCLHPNPRFGTRAQVFLLPPADGSGHATNPLTFAYPPLSYDPARPSLTTADHLYDGPAPLFQYLASAIPRALAWHLHAALLPTLDAAGGWRSGVHLRVVVSDPARSGRPELHVRGTVVHEDGDRRTVDDRLCTWGEAWEGEGMGRLEDVVRGMMMAAAGGEGAGAGAGI
ncbi:mediator of RNA polymerase II transcription subunit 17 [Podospora conica]|nr:mediator of RNA polymerase II transcription subunit 17 [Schizothecium conicum]